MNEVNSAPANGLAPDEERELRSALRRLDRASLALLGVFLFVHLRLPEEAHVGRFFTSVACFCIVLLSLVSETAKVRYFGRDSFWLWYSRALVLFALGVVAVSAWRAFVGCPASFA